MEGIRIEPLKPNRMLQAYPLIREAIPAITLDAWSRFARARTEPRRHTRAGIRVAMTEDERFPCGLVCYRVERHMLFGNILVADQFVAIDLLDPRPVFERLIDDLEGLGAALECREIRSVLHYRSTRAAQPLFAAGYQPQGIVFSKHLGAGEERMPPVALT